MPVYAFVDETFNPYMDDFFLVSILVINCTSKKELFEHNVYKKLIDAEAASHIKAKKWFKCSGRQDHKRRVRYINIILESTIFTNNLFFGYDFGIKAHRKIDEMAIYIAESLSSFYIINAIETTKAIISIDGLDRSNHGLITNRLNRRSARTKKIIGVKKDESNPFIRLVDRICGLARYAIEYEISGDPKQKWAHELLELLRKNSTLIRI